jgi:hypothetical protein
MGERFDFILDELFDPIEFLLVFRIGFEVPSHYSLPFRVFFWAAGRQILPWRQVFPGPVKPRKGKDTLVSKRLCLTIITDCRARWAERGRALSWSQQQEERPWASRKA